VLGFVSLTRGAQRGQVSKLLKRSSLVAPQQAVVLHLAPWQASWSHLIREIDENILRMCATSAAKLSELERLIQSSHFRKDEVYLERTHRLEGETRGD
jgi:hypothetical protein